MIIDSKESERKAFGQPDSREQSQGRCTGGDTGEGRGGEEEGLEERLGEQDE